MDKQPSNYAKHPLDFWHWGDSADFVDLAQEEHWIRVVQSLERGDPSAFRRIRNHKHKKFAGYTLEVQLTSALAACRAEAFKLISGEVLPARAFIGRLMVSRTGCDSV